MTRNAKYKDSLRPNRTLVMLSGGLDSTAALWHVLNRPNEYGDIHVHHVNIINTENRWRAEAEAVRAVLSYVREHAPAKFTTSNSTIATPQFGNKIMYDVEVYCFVTGYMTSRDLNITKVIFGGTKTDIAMGISDTEKRGYAMYNAFHPEDENHGKRVTEYPHSHLTKNEVYKTLPPKLAKLTWSCRTPSYINGKPLECGECKTCILEMKDVERPKLPGRYSAKKGS